MLFTGAFTVNRWRLTIGNKMSDKTDKGRLASEVTGRARERASADGHNRKWKSNKRWKGEGIVFYAPRRRTFKHARWCIMHDSYDALTLRQAHASLQIVISFWYSVIVKLHQEAKYSQDFSFNFEFEANDKGVRSWKKIIAIAVKAHRYDWQFKHFFKLAKKM